METQDRRLGGVPGGQMGNRRNAEIDRGSAADPWLNSIRYLIIVGAARNDLLV
jgi:hypothetical protein